MLRAYADAFQAAGLAAGLPLYLASGIFESEPGFAGAWRHGHASAHAHKEALLEAGELAALLPEQRAAVDFLVAVRAERFVGWATSSFSFWVAEARALAGLPPEASHLIPSPGSEASLSAFARANGVLLPPGETHGLGG